MAGGKGVAQLRSRRRIDHGQPLEVPDAGVECSGAAFDPAEQVDASGAADDVGGQVEAGLGAAAVDHGVDAAAAQVPPDGAEFLSGDIVGFGGPHLQGQFETPVVHVQSDDLIRPGPGQTLQHQQPHETAPHQRQALSGAQAAVVHAGDGASHRLDDPVRVVEVGLGNPVDPVSGQVAQPREAPAGDPLPHFEAGHPLAQPGDVAHTFVAGRCGMGRIAARLEGLDVP